MTSIDTPALNAIRDQLAIEQLALRDDQGNFDMAVLAYDEARERLTARAETVASLEASLAALTPATDPEPEGAA